MKKMMMVMCLLGLTAMIYAQSPGDRMVISENFRIQNEAAQKGKAEAAKKAAAAAAEKAAVDTAAKKAVQTANKEAKDAESQLKYLAQNFTGFQKELNAVAKKHGDVVAALQKIESNDSFFYQNAEIVLEDFAGTVSQIKDDNLQKIVKGIINHKYYFPRKSVTKLFTLKEAAAAVNEGALEAGNGIPSAGLQDNGFYKSLN